MFARRAKGAARHARKLEVSLAGYWYTALTIGMGVVALISGNNVLYLVESLLLSGMILSGVLSERTVSAVSVEIRRVQGHAGEGSRDRVLITNHRDSPLFCLEIGEWRNRQFEALVFVPKLGAKSSLTTISRAKHGPRGEHAWEAVAAATSYPFGFARKVKLLEGEGKRCVWPARVEAQAERAPAQGVRAVGARSGIDFAEGEVRPLTPGDDFREVVWTLSAKGNGPYVRARRAEADSPEVRLDTRIDARSESQAEAEFEKRILAAAQPFHRQARESIDGVLVIVDQEGSRTVRGKRQALDWLARARRGAKRVKL